VADTRAHSSQPGGAGAPQEAHEEGLGLIVARVRHRDRGRPGFLAHAKEKRVALPARRLLEPAPLAAGAGGDIGRRRMERHLQPPAETAAEIRVLWGIRAQPVVEVGGHQPEAAAAGEGHEGVQQGDRVGPPGEAQDDALTRPESAGGPQGPIDGRDQRR